MSKRSKYRCSRHGFYDPDFDRRIDGYACPRILCEKCEEESYSADFHARPRNVKYYYEDNEMVLLQEAHNGSAVWKFKPPVVTPEWHFAEDLTPVIPEGAKTSEQLMVTMEGLLPEVERVCKERGIGVPETNDLVILPKEVLNGGQSS
jgi:hypothetical protein